METLFLTNRMTEHYEAGVTPITILLADDHPIVVEGVNEILKTMPNIHVGGVAYDGEALLSLARTVKADLIILDMNMPKKDGMQCARILKREQPHTKLLFMTMYHDIPLINEMIQVGANGCLLKSKGSKDLRAAIDRIMNGKSFFDFIPEAEIKPAEEPLRISDREIEVIKLICQGKGSLEIADQLFISEHTVKTHRKNIMKKLDLHNVSQLMQYALSKGWV